MKAPDSQSPASDHPPQSAVVDSCRVPVVLLLFCAGAWLVWGSAVGFLASLKFHAPGIAADSSWLTYGRLHPLQQTAYLYGFAFPAAWAIALWLLARLGHAPLRARWMVITGVLVWNLALKLGSLGILAGQATGYEGIALPRYAALMLIVGYGFIGIPALLTFQGRRRADLYVSQWFLLAALFWFPWIYTTALALLILVPVRGVMQPLVDWWYQANAHQVALGFLGLAILFHVIPNHLKRPLHSRYLAMTAFWLLVLFVGWSGVPDSAPLPSWIPGVSTVFTVFLVVPLIAIALNFHHTLAGRYSDARQNGLLAVAMFSLGAYLLAGVLTVALALPALHPYMQFTFFVPGKSFLFLYGFVAMAIFAGLYQALDDLIPGGLPSVRLRKIHLWCAGAGVVLYGLPMLLGGLVQGMALMNPEVPFMDTLRPGLMALRISTLGDISLIAGHLALMANFLLAAFQYCRSLRDRTLPVLQTPMEVRQ
jgi:cytochrome c oxidase cbb3-type subunit 1